MRDLSRSMRKNEKDEKTVTERRSVCMRVCWKVERLVLLLGVVADIYFDLLSSDPNTT